MFDEINSTISSIAFESFVIKVLTDYSASQGKIIITAADDDILGFDAFLPNGIESITDPTYVKAKFLKSTTGAYFRAIESFSKEVSKKSIKQVLFILGVDISSQNKYHLHRLAESRSQTQVIIWELSEFKQKTKAFYDNYIEFLNNPNRAIVDTAINEKTTTQQRNATKTTLLTNLKYRYDNEELALFVGAGVSMDAGIPLWSDLINRLLVVMIAKRIDKKDFKINTYQINKLINLAYINKEDSPISQIRYIRSAFEPSEYNNLVHNTLYEKKPKPSTQLLKAIADICAPQRNHIGVKGIITYNFDDLLERALKKRRINCNTVYCETDISSIDKLNIFHVHGFMPQYLYNTSKTIELIFSEEDYHRIYKDVYCWSNIIQLNYLRESTCLFIGCSLNDPNLRRLLDVAARIGEKPRHYAIMKRNLNITLNGIDEKITETYKIIDDNLREKYYASMGLNIIWIDNYSEIPYLLRKLI